MVFANVIGKGYEYRVRNWFVAKGWKSERNPLSGASDQIEEELGKHDVRAWKDDLNIFLQIECKKTMQKKKTKDGVEDDTIVIQKEWLDKIDFNNDEFLVFSFNRCQQHFAFMAAEAADKILQQVSHSLVKTDPIDPRGDSGFGFKRVWLEDKQLTICVVNFIGKMWYAMDLEYFIAAREQCKIPTKATSFEEQIKTIQNVEVLKELFTKESSTWTTRQFRIYYSKLERLESGKDNAYNPSFIKDSQFWLDEGKRFDWEKSAVSRISEKVQAWIDKNLSENEDGEIVWTHESQITSLEAEIAKTLGIKDDNKDSK